MRYLFHFCLFISILYIPESTLAIEPVVDWEKILDVWYEAESVRPITVQQTEDTGYIIAGSVYDSFGNCARLIKLDSNGSERWHSTFSAKIINSVQEIIGEGFIIGGIGYGNATTYGTDCFYLSKTDYNGNSIWEECWGSSGIDRIYSVQQTSDGGFIVAGHTGLGQPWAYLAKTDSGGVIQWQRNDFGPRTRFYSVKETNDGGYIAAGDISTVTSSTDIYLVKTNAIGVTQFEKNIGRSTIDYGYSVDQTFDGGYIVAGYTDKEGIGGKGTYLVKTDSFGNLIWENAYGGARAYSCQQTSDGGYILAGMSVSSYKPQGYIVKTNPSGLLQWNQYFTGNLETRLYSIQQTFDGGYIVAGITLKSPNNWNPAGYIIKLGTPNLFVVIPGMNTDGDVMVDGARRIVQDSFRVEEVNEKDGLTDDTVRDQVRQWASSAKANGLHLIINVDMDLGVVLPNLPPWRRAVEWAGNITNVIVAAFKDECPDSMCKLYAHSAGVDATYESMQLSRGKQMFDDLILMNGWTAAQRFRTILRSNGYEWWQVKVFTSEADIDGWAPSNLANPDQAWIGAETHHAWINLHCERIGTEPPGHGGLPDGLANGSTGNFLVNIAGHDLKRYNDTPVVNVILMDWLSESE